MSKLNKLIVKKDKSINKDLIKRHFKFQGLIDMKKHLYKTKNTEKSNTLVQLVESELSDLKKNIEEVSEREIKNKKLDEIVDIVEKILDCNYQNQEGQGLKILTPDQMLSKTPNTLAQFKAANNSKKLKNERRQLLYSFYCSKNLTKIIYNSLIKLFVKRWKQSL